jgi:hypothetical protein
MWPRGVARFRGWRGSQLPPSFVKTYSVPGATPTTSSLALPRPGGVEYCVFHARDPGLAVNTAPHPPPATHVLSPFFIPTAATSLRIAWSQRPYPPVPHHFQISKYYPTPHAAKHSPGCPVGI